MNCWKKEPENIVLNRNNIYNEFSIYEIGSILVRGEALYG